MKASSQSIINSRNSIRSKGTWYFIWNILYANQENTATIIQGRVDPKLIKNIFQLRIWLCAFHEIFLEEEVT